MEQHGLRRADMVPILGTPSRVSEVLAGKKGLSMAMVQRLRTLPRSRRPAVAATEESAAARLVQARRSLSRRTAAYVERSEMRER
jgi:HTH-type transcriptional regulator / antitoxin HigA